MEGSTKKESQHLFFGSLRPHLGGNLAHFGGYDSAGDGKDREKSLKEGWRAMKWWYSSHDRYEEGKKKELTWRGEKEIFSMYLDRKEGCVQNEEKF